MIAAVHGKGGAGGACDYVFERKKEEKEPTILGGTLAGRDGREVRAELEALTGLRPDVERGVFHGSLSAAPGEQPTPEQWADMAARWMERLKLDSYVVVQHHDAEHAHVHVLAARITPVGRVLSDAYDALKSQEVARELEQKYELQRVPASWEKGAERAERAPTRAELGRAERLGQPEPFITAVRRGAGDDFARATSWEDLTQRLEARGLTIRPGKKGAGLVVAEIGGREQVKASDVGRAYSRGNLEKRLGDYDRFVERQQQRRDEPARLLEQPAEQQRGEAGRIQERYAGLAVPDAARGEGRPGAGGPGEPGRDVGRGGEPGRAVDAGAPGAARGGENDRDDRGARLHDVGREGDGRAAGLQGAGGAGGRGEGDRAAARAAATELGGAAPLPDVAGRGGAGGGAVAPVGRADAHEVGDRGRAADDRGAARVRDEWPGALGAVPGPADAGRGSVRDRAGDALPSPAGAVLPADRAGIERALTEARRAAQLHAAADRAAQAHHDAYAQLYRDPAGARAQVEAMQRSAPEVAADLLRRSLQTFGTLTDEAARQVANGRGRDLTDAIGKTGQGAREADALRPRTPAAQLGAQVERLEGALAPLLARDREQAWAKEIAERVLGLDRDRGRGR